MARARNIKPGFFKNADLVELSIEARLLFIGLWTLADRAGRLEDRPKQIKMELFPADAVDVDACLEGLQQWGFVARYQVDGRRLLQVVNFDKHQNPHRDEKVSALPTQDGTFDEAPQKHGSNTVQARCPNGVATVAIGLIPDSLIPDSLPSVPNGTDAAAAPAVDSAKPSKTPEEMAKAELWSAAVSVLEAGGCPRSQCRTFMGRLVGDYGFDVMKQAVSAAVSAQPADAREYLKAVCQRLKGERTEPSRPVTVPSGAANETSAYLESQRMTDDEKAAAAEARQRALAALKVAA